VYFVGPSSKNGQAVRFWEFFKEASKRHELSSSEVMDRFVAASSMAISRVINKCDMPFGSKNVLLLSGEPTAQPSFREDHSGNGLLIQYFLPHIPDIAKYVRPEDQTLSVFGFSHEEISSLLTSLSNRGIDRVVPIGQALEFSNMWDGIDLLDAMSRKIDISKLNRQ
jgi:hypothetical protein